jgi:hypothetical protein
MCLVRNGYEERDVGGKRAICRMLGIYIKKCHH